MTCDQQSHCLQTRKQQLSHSLTVSGCAQIPHIKRDRTMSEATPLLPLAKPKTTWRHSAAHRSITARSEAGSPPPEAWLGAPVRGGEPACKRSTPPCRPFGGTASGTSLATVPERRLGPLVHVSVDMSVVGISASLHTASHPSIHTRRRHNDGADAAAFCQTY